MRNIAHRILKRIVMAYNPYHYSKEMLRFEEETLANRKNDLLKIMQSIDMERFDQLRRKWNSNEKSKYLDIEKYIMIRLLDVYRLNIHRRGPMKILDLGTGCAYFPVICRYFGHDVFTLDIDVNDMYNEVVACFHIPRKIHRIEKFVPLPGFQHKYDLVTAFDVVFNNHGSEQVWGKDEWSFLVSDIRENLLVEDGEIFFLINPERRRYRFEKIIYSFFEKDLKAEVFGRNEGRAVYLGKRLGDAMWNL